MSDDPALAEHEVDLADETELQRLVSIMGRMHSSIDISSDGGAYLRYLLGPSDGDG